MAERLTKLKAVNTMLACIGETPVNTLDSATATADITMAKTLLDDITSDVLTEGWNFNTDYNYPLVPDNTGTITLPLNTLRVDSDYCPELDVIERAGKLYSRFNRTFTFTSQVKVDITFLLDFEELPESARRYIMIRAARIFQDRTLGSDSFHTYSLKDEQRAYATLREAEGETGDHSIFDNYDTFQIMNRSINSGDCY